MKIVFLLLVLSGCAQSHLAFKERAGAHELVVDSYKIRQEKMPSHTPSKPITVVGEVKRPQEIEVTGPLTLHEVLERAGGITRLGNKNSLFVIRNDQVYELCWDHVEHLPHDSLLLMPGDTLSVPSHLISSLFRVSP